MGRSVYIRCIVLEHVFIRIPLESESTYLLIKTYVFVNLKESENKTLNHIALNVFVLL